MEQITASAFAVWNGDEDGWAAIDERCVLHDANRPEPVVGRDAIRATIAEYRSAMPDLHVDAGDTLAIGDLTAQVWTATSGGRVLLRGVSVGRHRGDRLVESWIVTAEMPS
jgi:hypothetical protein